MTREPIKRTDGPLIMMRRTSLTTGGINDRLRATSFELTVRCSQTDASRL